jgi:transposase-like protein
MSRRISKKAEEVIKKMMEERVFEHPLALAVKAGARMMLQVAVEEEITDYLGRDYYERTEEAEGYRNGYKGRTVKLSCGDIKIDMPQARGVDSPFHSKLISPYKTRMKEIEELIPQLYLNGISTRKVKRAVKKVLGKRGLSHQTVSKLTEKIVEEFKGWKERDLSGLKILYLIMDGIRIGVRGGTGEKEAVLVATAYLEDGERVLISVELGNRESYNSWKMFIEDMRRRGLRDPLLIITDGSPGLLRAVEEIFPGVDTQRCTKHKMENILEKVLKEDKEEVRDDARKIFYAHTIEHAREGISIFEKKWKKYTSAVECLLKDIEACLTYYKFPYIHWKRIRTTNAIERGFREVRQRVRVIGRFQNEDRALALVYWKIKDAQERWNGLCMTEEAKEILRAIKNSKLMRACPEISGMAA